MSPSEASIGLVGELGGLGLRGSVTEPRGLEMLVESTLER